MGHLFLTFFFTGSIFAQVSHHNHLDYTPKNKLQLFSCSPLGITVRYPQHATLIIITRCCLQEQCAQPAHLLITLSMTSLWTSCSQHSPLPLFSKFQGNFCGLIYVLLTHFRSCGSVQGFQLILFFHLFVNLSADLLGKNTLTLGLSQAAL